MPICLQRTSSGWTKTTDIVIFNVAICNTEPYPNNDFSSESKVRLIKVHKQLTLVAGEWTEFREPDHTLGHPQKSCRAFCLTLLLSQDSHSTFSLVSTRLPDYWTDL